jgi:hypothetical protein
MKISVTTSIATIHKCVCFLFTDEHKQTNKKFKQMYILSSKCNVRWQCVAQTLTHTYAHTHHTHTHTHTHTGLSQDVI